MLTVATESLRSDGEECINAAVQKVSSYCLSTVMMDEPWKDLGFSGRPKHGAFFQRFRSAWKVELEKSILREMLAVFTAVHIKGNVVHTADIPDLVDAYTGHPELVRALGFDSKSIAQQHIRNAVDAYVRLTPDQWPVELCSRLKVTSLPETYKSRLIPGCMEFGQNAQMMIGFVK